MMNGNMGVRSTFGRGTIFWLEITLNKNTTASELDIPTDEILQGARILIINASKASYAIISEQLKPYKMHIHGADTPEDALLLLENNHNFDIAILDSTYSENNSFKLAQTLKNNPATKDIALIMITSTPSRGDKLKMENAGFSAYFNKPLIFWQLLNAIAIIMDAKSTGRNVPLITQHSLKEMKASQHKSEKSSISFPNTTILLAEDNPVNQMIAATLLEKYGCTIITAINGKEAVQKFQDHNFDMVLMDCHMPEMDGYEATREIRKLELSEARKRIPIIAFTANMASNNNDKFLDAGMDDLLTKPVIQFNLENMLAKWLSKNHSHKNPRHILIKK